jgi:hypothetical protein
MPSNRKEANIVNDCLVALSAAGCLVWRQNTGALRDGNGRLVRYGLCKGSSDIVGICQDGRFLAVECKADGGRLSEAQDTFLAAVIKAGGRAGVARCADDALRIASGG